jgi:energy-converting hydrogenase Eha subunit C
VFTVAVAVKPPETTVLFHANVPPVANGAAIDAVIGVFNKAQVKTAGAVIETVGGVIFCVTTTVFVLIVGVAVAFPAVIPTGDPQSNNPPTFKGAAIDAVTLVFNKLQVRILGAVIETVGAVIFCVTATVFVLVQPFVSVAVTV